jgi:hypothetical protein
MLCRTQFIARARGLKIAQLQQAASARAPRGREAGGPGYAMLQGDGWAHGGGAPRR